MRMSMVRPILDYLTNGARQENGWWRDWQITRITDGRNNLVYRASGPRGDLALKFTVRDERDRAFCAETRATSNATDWITILTY